MCPLWSSFSLGLRPSLPPNAQSTFVIEHNFRHHAVTSKFDAIIPILLQNNHLGLGRAQLSAVFATLWRARRCRPGHQSALLWHGYAPLSVRSASARTASISAAAASRSAVSRSSFTFSAASISLALTVCRAVAIPAYAPLS